MATKQTDTDPIPAPHRGDGDLAGAGPLTPSKIIAVSAAPTEPTPKMAGSDPGVAPPALSEDLRRGPANVVVKPPTKADSVDMLLDGVLQDKPQPAKIARATSGDAVASYQAQHDLHRGVPTPPPEEKVIVDLPKQSAQPTMKIDRAQVPRPPPGLLDEGPPQGPRGQERTVVTPKQQGPKIVFALGAAALITFAAFIMFKLWSNDVKQQAILTDPTASALVDISRPPPQATAATTAPPPPATVAEANEVAPPSTVAAPPETTTASAPPPPEPRTNAAAMNPQPPLAPVKRVFTTAATSTGATTAPPATTHKTDLKPTLE